MSSSDSDDDVPLAQLKAKSPVKKTGSTPAKRGVGSNKRKTSGKSPASTNKKAKTDVISSSESSSNGESEGDSSSDDDVSLAVMLKKKKAASGKKQPSSAKKKKKPAAKKSTKKAKSKVTTASQKSATTGALGLTDITTYRSTTGSRKIVKSGKTKEQLVLAVLTRWWYAFEWPTKENLAEAREAMKERRNYSELAGMPGVFICIVGPDTGKLIDMRNKKQGIFPSVETMMKKAAPELLDLWVKGLEGQITALKESSEENPKLLKSLEDELAVARKEQQNPTSITSACERQGKKKKK